jgi:uncharacterized protein DUF6627
MQQAPEAAPDRAMEGSMSCFPRLLRFATALLLLFLYAGVHVVPAAAALAPSRVSGMTQIVSTRDGDLLVVQRVLENKVVAQKLRDYGVQPEEVRTRLASMSDDEIHQIATASAGIPSGSDGLGALIAILIIILLVIIILKILNKDIIIK